MSRRGLCHCAYPDTRRLSGHDAANYYEDIHSVKIAWRAHEDALGLTAGLGVGRSAFGGLLGAPGGRGGRVLAPPLGANIVTATALFASASGRLHADIGYGSRRGPAGWSGRRT